MLSRLTRFLETWNTLASTGTTQSAQTRSDGGEGEAKSIISSGSDEESSRESFAVLSTVQASICRRTVCVCCVLLSSHSQLILHQSEGMYSIIFSVEAITQILYLT